MESGSSDCSAVAIRLAIPQLDQHSVPFHCCNWQILLILSSILLVYFRKFQVVAIREPDQHSGLPFHEEKMRPAQ